MVIADDSVYSIAQKRGTGFVEINRPNATSLHNYLPTTKVELIETISDLSLTTHLSRIVLEKLPYNACTRRFSVAVAPPAN
jgi:hypothetical protein